MSEATAEPWLQIIGIGEDGLDGLSVASKKRLQDASCIIGSDRQLTLAGAGEKGIAWPVPFSVDPVMARRGQAVVMLASGDPFWFGAGSAVTRHLRADEWYCHPSPSTFSLAAARLGWALDKTDCIALHARPFDDMRMALQPDGRAIVLLRDGAAVQDFTAWLEARGFAGSNLYILEALGGARERIRRCTTDALPSDIIDHPVAVALAMQGDTALPLVPGRDIDLFHHDGQISKSPVRAMTLARLAPRDGQLLWDLGAGSGAISVEWCLAGTRTRAIAIEQHQDRAGNITANIDDFGLSARMQVLTGDSLELIAGLPDPDAVFIGGGVDDKLLAALFACLPAGCRLVANAVTLESAALLGKWQGDKGGDLTQIAISHAKPLGRMQGWQAAYPVTQWVVTV